MKSPQNISLFVALPGFAWILWRLLARDKVIYSTKKHNRGIVTAVLRPAMARLTSAYVGFPGSNGKAVAQMLFISQLTPSLFLSPDH